MAIEVIEQKIRDMESGMDASEKPKRDLTIDQAIEAAIKVSSAIKTTKRDYQLRAAKFIAWMGDEHPDVLLWKSVLPWHIQQFINTLDLAWDSKRHCLFVLKMTGKFMMHNYDVKDRTISVKLPVRPKPNQDQVPYEKLEEFLGNVLDWCEDEVVITTTFLIGLAGFHVQEALNLRRHDVNWESGVVHIRTTEHHRKLKCQYYEREIPLLPILIEMLRHCASRHKGEYVLSRSRGLNPADDHRISPAITKLLVKAGYNGIRPRSLRKTFSSLMHAINPIADRVIERYLGRAPKDTGGRYYIAIGEQHFREHVIAKLHGNLDKDFLKRAQFGHIFQVIEISG